MIASHNFLIELSPCNSAPAGEDADGMDEDEPEASTAVVLHEDKKYYPDADEVYPDAETLVQVIFVLNICCSVHEGWHGQRSCCASLASPGPWSLVRLLSRALPCSCLRAVLSPTIANHCRQP